MDDRGFCETVAAFFEAVDFGKKLARVKGDRENLDSILQMEGFLGENRRAMYDALRREGTMAV